MFLKIYEKCEDIGYTCIKKMKDKPLIFKDKVTVVSTYGVLDRNDTVSNKAIMREKVNLTQTNFKPSNPKKRHECKIDEDGNLNLRCKETSIRTSPMYPDDTNYAKKVL